MRSVALSIIGIAVLLIGTNGTAWADPFPAGYTAYEYDGHWYAITHDYGNWTTCEEEAVAVGGHLATVDDSLENAWLSTAFQGYYRQDGYGDSSVSLVWIGFEWDEDDWTWSSGDAVTLSPPWYNGAGGRPHGGLHAYLHTDTHYQPGSWWEDTVYDGIDPSFHVRGIIEVVPEPVTMSVLALGGLALLKRKKA